MTKIAGGRDAWGYLMETVSTEIDIEYISEKASYYMANGTPPGTWEGQGAKQIGLTSTGQITEEDLYSLFGLGRDPLLGETLGREFPVAPSFEALVEKALTKLREDSVLADLSDEDLLDKATEIALQVPKKEAVAGYELVFSPPKSVSSWWAIADPKLKDQIREAHHEARKAAMQYLEEDIIRTRTGARGVAVTKTRGIIAASFDHWDSRENDPQLHTHVLISNKVQGEDGRWRTIDGRMLFPAISSAGAYYDTFLMDILARRFGVEWTTDDILQNPKQYLEWRKESNLDDTPASRMQFSIENGVAPASIKWQIEGVPHKLNKLFSSRSKALNEEKDKQIAAYIKKYGVKPSNSHIIKLRQRTALSTRRSKSVLSLKELTTSWRERAMPVVGDSFLAAERIIREGRKRITRYGLWSFRNDDVKAEQIDNVVQQVLKALTTEKSAWVRTRAESIATTYTAHWRLRSADDRRALVKRITDLVIENAVPLTPKSQLHTPTHFMADDGASKFQPEILNLYTTREIWEAEERLLAAGTDTNYAVVNRELVNELIARPTLTEARILSDDQQAAVENIVTSGRLVDVLVGPAGAGKTTSLEKLKEIWEAEHGQGSVRGLAPTARASEVLAESLGIKTDNTAKWIFETGRGTANKDGFNFTLNPNDLLIIDEASIAGTTALDELRRQAKTAGAKLLLVGDPAQLAAVDAGGAFGMLVNDRHDVAELKSLHRFKADWEADASKLLRVGKTSVIDQYVANERIFWGLDETIVDEAVEAWKIDEAQINDDGTNHVSLLIAPTNEMVERLNQIARKWRIEQGLVDEEKTVEIQNEAVASVGDRIVTRRNARTLKTDHDRWVKNNDEWVIKSIKSDGSIIATAGEEKVKLPATYVKKFVQLAYATTAHRSQGRTVDTAHTIVDSAASRETFYVAMTRGKQSNKAYILVDEENTLGDRESVSETRTWGEILENVITTRSSQISAHDTAKEELEVIGSMRRLLDEYNTIASTYLERKYEKLLKDNNAWETQDSMYLGPVLANLCRLETQGEDLAEVIPQLLESRELETAESVLAVLHHRTRRYLAHKGANRINDDYTTLLDSLGIKRHEIASVKNREWFYQVLKTVENKTNGQLEQALREALQTIGRDTVRKVPVSLAKTLQKRYSLTKADLRVRQKVFNSSLINGFLEKLDVDDIEVRNALADRENAMRIRAELLIEIALSNKEAWLEGLATSKPDQQHLWKQKAIAVATYRDLYGISSTDPLGKCNFKNVTQKIHRELVSTFALKKKDNLHTKSSLKELQHSQQEFDDYQNGRYRKML